MFREPLLTRVLLAEDDPTTREILREHLAAMDFAPECVADGQAALSTLMGHDPPRLAVLDWEMPGLDGPEVIRRLRHERTEPYIYTMLLTIRDAKSDVIAGLDAGADDYLPKPIDGDVLRARLRVGQRICQLHGELHDQLQTNRLQQERLAEGYTNLQALLNAPSGLMLLLEADGRILDLNEAAAEHLGGTVGEVRGRSLLDMLPEKLVPHRRAKMRKALEEGTVIHFEDEYNGRHLGLSYYPIRDRTGRFVRLAVYGADITAKRRVREALAASEAQKRSILEAIPSSIIYFSREHRILWANPSAASQGGLFPDQMIGERCCHFWQACDGEMMCGGDCVVEQAFESRLPQERAMQTPGDRHWELYARPVAAPGGEIDGVVLVAVDVTERVRMERQLANLNASLEARIEQRTEEVRRLLQQKNSFVNRLGHDLRTPLTPIIALLPLLRNSLRTPRDQRILQMLENASEYIRNLAERTLRLAELNEAAPNVQPGPVDLADVARHALHSVSYEVNRLELSVHEPTRAPVWALGDDVYVREVVVALLSNAVAASRTGGWITIDVTSAGAEAVLAIRDEGAGMTAEQLARAFEEFYQADESRHDRTRTGLGLSIARRIAQSLGGEIRLESPGPGRGTIATFVLPAYVQPAPSADGPGQAVEKRE